MKPAYKQKNPTISNVKSLDLWSSRAGQIRTCRGKAPPSCLRKTVLFRISRAFPNLALDRFFALVVTGIAGVNYGGHRLTSFFFSFFLSNRRVAFCILVDLPCTVKAHFAGIVVFEPCVHIAQIQFQVRVKTIIRQFLFSAGLLRSHY